MTSPIRCRCGHGVAAHEHFRAGRECSACHPGGCRRFRAAAAGFDRPSALVAGITWHRFRSALR